MLRAFLIASTTGRQPLRTVTLTKIRFIPESKPHVGFAADGETKNNLVKISGLALNILEVMMSFLQILITLFRYHVFSPAVMPTCWEKKHAFFILFLIQAGFLFSIFLLKEVVQILKKV